MEPLYVSLLFSKFSLIITLVTLKISVQVIPQKKQLFYLNIKAQTPRLILVSLSPKTDLPTGLFQELQSTRCKFCACKSKGSTQTSRSPSPAGLQEILSMLRSEAKCSRDGKTIMYATCWSRCRLQYRKREGWDSYLFQTLGSYQMFKLAMKNTRHYWNRVPVYFLPVILSHPYAICLNQKKKKRALRWPHKIKQLSK